jgi:hypothetical protein
MSLGGQGSAENPWNFWKGGNTMSDLNYEELKAKLAELEKNLPVASGGALHFKVAAKGGVSAYGLGRYPVTLYYEQWHKLLDGAESLRAFLEANKGALKMRDQGSPSGNGQTI